ncbi:MAG: type IX secretion system sortase PorU [Candidatus Marinimicrobia bacterium]|nr:type IX secretion system sortase PorU [Candidatus Neomarinimicrobiota bacterium]MCF7905082.1 type IX secretion system sortase PorU [Candidatus Neomarinimicrobiota bacterium]
MAAIDMTVLEESGNRIEIEINFEDPTTAYIELAEEQIPYPRWSNASLSYHQERRQLLPLFTVPILLPPDGSLPTVEIIESEFSNTEIRTTPITLNDESYLYKDLSSRSPAELISLQQTEALADHQTGTVLISPLAEAGKRLKRIHLALNFSDLGSGSRGTGDMALIQSYPNAKMARSWGKPQRRTRSLAKAADDLPSGLWFKIPIDKTGIYQITPEVFGGDIPGSNPNSWMVYAPYYEGVALPKQLEVGSTPKNLRSISIQGSGLEDGDFSGSDAITFFARTLNADFKGDNFTHLYDTQRYYWLCIPDIETPNVNSIAILESSSNSPTDIIESYEKRFYHEAELHNQLHSGENWVGEKLSKNGDQLSFNITDDFLDQDGEIDLSAHFIYDYHGNTRAIDFDVSLNGLPLNTTGKRFSLNLSHLVRGTASETMMQNGTNVLSLKYLSTDSRTMVYLDSLRFSYFRQLAPSNDYLFGTIYPDSSVNELRFTDLPTNFKIWDISDPQAVVEYAISDERFVKDGSGSFEIIGFSEDQVISSVLLPASNLGTPQLRHPDQQADYVIITPELFLEEAEQIKELREQLVDAKEQLTVKIARLEDIYDEFSAGTQDPGAIKHFLHYTFFSWQTPRPAYVLLMGDTDYDYRNISGLSKMRVPTIQIDATSELWTYSCDDRFTYLSSGPADELPDISIGRLPAQSRTEMANMVDKIIAYETKPEPGTWRNTLTLVADDPLRPSTIIETDHILDSEFIDYLVPNSIYVDKLYLTEYPEVQDPNSPYVKKPQARDALIKKLYNGTLLVNYLGHGSPNVWAQENVLTSSDLGQVKTGMRLPFWVAGTCDWAKYDDIGVSCAPEELLRMERNGAVGVLSATRKTYATYNIIIMGHFYNLLFPEIEGSRSIAVGDAIRVAKNQYGSNSKNNEKYVLLSDPALRLASPQRKGKITNISPSALKAMGKVQYSGITDTVLSESAMASVTVYDTPTPVKRYFDYNGGTANASISYVLPGQRIFRGLVSVQDTLFSGSFTLPKDIKYSGEGGILNVQYWDDTGLDGSIYLDTLKFLGSDSTTLNEEGPDILFLSDNMVLLNGDNFSANDALQVELNDPQGINLTGSAGHGISLAIDEEWENAQDLTELFEYDLDRSDIGQLSVYLSDIQPGEHQISIKAWDTQNNPNESSIRLTFFAATDFRAYDLFNFPNPMTDQTDITYMLSHDADVNVSVYTLAGRKIFQQAMGYQSQGFNTTPWDGRDTYGNLLANGVYILVLEAENDEFEKPSQILQKVVIAR